MKQFMGKNFLLENDTAKVLYHNYAKEMPIHDFHNHLSAKSILDDIQFKNITQVWLGGDHYKWRALRTNGIVEQDITGDTPDHEKFLLWAKTMPYLVGNPLYHWTHLELQRYFNIYEQLNKDTAEMIWKKCNEKLQTKEFTVRNLIKMMNIKVLCTTDDPVDNLESHIAIAKENLDFKVFPTFRPDKAIHIEKPDFVNYVNSLSEVVGYEISCYNLLEKALLERLEFFHENGARVSDHALDEVLYASSTEKEVSEIFQKALKGEELSLIELKQYKGYILTQLGKAYSKKGWVMQLHIGALRNNSSRMFKKLGPDTGFDSINDEVCAKDLSKLLDSMDAIDELPKTILYCLNPRDNEVLATMLGNFQGGGIAGKIQFGSGWWFNDQKDGMERQLEALAQLGMLSRFVGMLTDSRSFLSFPRHEYFRRILCNKLGKYVENGEYPNEVKFLGKVVQDICFNNAVNYFDIEIS
ncbi:glucuronate isomerase [Candidatus Epulonipiscium fishelsonii]|uniref:Glucuronate isomerase n=1 Tax=Candidatus Epulonipiscium fishelsonii TaxID=77094 RepID=A0ACC8X822_9FIRM|nr:glucuronate isomerase [Epulopiscium sp. SCG-B11WGA-EpuloA1]ONI40718.1 glucuronate isomerase [Epulopiscium sp. SCG-B05WGA-EpuloA1]